MENLNKRFICVGENIKNGIKQQNFGWHNIEKHYFTRKGKKIRYHELYNRRIEMRALWKNIQF